MTDQNQSKLTLEEELDVLEAVYKIGKEKGLELLRPEQVKKLRDGGRMEGEKAMVHGAINGKSLKRSEAQVNAIKMADLFIFTLKKSVERILLEEENYCTPEEWRKKSIELRSRVVDVFFYLFYGMKESELRLGIITKFTGGKL